ncbi:hypothetical protein BTR23_10785 [Alkalihalophilus pseudofirmus]|nr:hypothetical protein BTR23_10785 [Alkalihalophilus pseudofirmus]
MKKNILVSLFILALGLLVLVGCSGGEDVSGEDVNNGDNEGAEATEEVFTLNLNNITSPTSVYVTDVLEPWKELVEEKTSGRVEVNLYHSATLGSPTSVLQDVEGGLYEIGLLLPHYFYDSSVFPFTITNLPFALSHVSIEDTVSIMNEFSNQYSEEIWQNVKPLSISSADDSVVVSKVPIRGMEDLKNLNTRTQGSNDSYLAETWGGSPVALPLTEIYSGLQTGIIDLTINTSLGDATDLHLYEVAPYATKFKFNRVPIVFIMSNEVFENMPEDLQQLFEEELNPAFQDLSEKAALKSQEEGMERLMENFEEVIEISDEQYEEFSLAGEKIWNDWLDDANSRGYDGEKMLGDFKELLKSKGYSLPYED